MRYETQRFADGFQRRRNGSEFLKVRRSRVASRSDDATDDGRVLPPVAPDLGQR
jgi:hypothetical protein